MPFVKTISADRSPNQPAGPAMGCPNIERQLAGYPGVRRQHYPIGCMTTRPPLVISTYRLWISRNAMPTSGVLPTASTSTCRGPIVPEHRDAVYTEANFCIVSPGRATAEKALSRSGLPSCSRVFKVSQEIASRRAASPVPRDGRTRGGSPSCDSDQADCTNARFYLVPLKT